MNGEVKTYALNRPMRWKEFKLLPDDVRREYIENLQKRFGVMQKDLAVMFGVSVNSVGLETKKLGIKFPHRGGWANTNNGGFRAFCAEEPKADPVEALTEPVHSTPEVAEPSEEVKDLDAPTVQNRGGAPKSGNLCFENTTTTEALNLVYSVLGSVSMAKLSVSWEA